MERTDFDNLTTDTARELIDRHISGDPARLALKLRNPTVTQQIKVLQKCRHKLPSYYVARCIVPQVAYEQASSEATAAVRTAGFPAAVANTLAVDLTCGLGVDTLALSQKFGRVISVEIDPLRADIARWNFAQLGAGNVEIINDSAEHFIESYPVNAPQIDFVYVDPSRKKSDGKRVFSLEESSPNILELLPILRQKARQIIIKLSPLFDVGEVYRLFGPDTCVEVISVDGECKEVVAKIGFNNNSSPASHTPHMRVTCIRRGEVRRFDFDRDNYPALPIQSPSGGPAMAEARFLLVPDVAFYKSRTVGPYMAQYYPDEIQSGNIRIGDYLFCDDMVKGFAGKTFRITFRHPYQPKEIARILKTRGIRRVNIHRRNFTYSADQIAQAFGIEQGGSTDIFCTLADGEPTVFFVGRIE